MPSRRSAGILLHPTSLPSRGGIGDLGPAAYEFVNFLSDARQGLWQILPLAPTGVGNSPYSTTSAFAGNPLLVSLERLAERGWIDAKKLSHLPESGASVNYEEAGAAKLPLLRQAAENFLRNSDPRARQRYQHFCRETDSWRPDFVLFDGLRQHHGKASWSAWPDDIRRRQPEALDKIRRELGPELEIASVIQFFFFEQWAALRRECARRGIRIIGDVAIFISYDSADVWTHPEIFHLDENLAPYLVAGVPPDAFSVTGQRWGNPLYRWDVLKSRGYDWWIERMRWALAGCDIIRLDHFRGFEQYWEIPASQPTAEHGRWVDGPGDDLFHALRKALGELPFIAEDLGFITPAVHALRDRLQIPGMRVMQFGFGDPGAHIYLPHRFPANTVVYSGTHDNDTTLGWWRSWAAPHEKAAAAAYFFGERDPQKIPEAEIPWAFVRAAATSVANLSVIPLQDILGLGSEARMNVPSHADGNWAWRYSAAALRPEIAARLAEITQVSDRDTLKELSRGEQSHGETSEEFAA